MLHRRGGPAGLMLGYLLARAGVDVVVLEKHDDFLRDFRGDTIHPSTLTVLDDLGLLEALLQLPHQEVRELTGEVYGETVTIADFTHLPAPRPFMVLIPQWDFLDFIAAQAQRLPNFALRMATQALGVIEDGARVVGVEAKTAAGPLAVHADLVVAADGRHSTLRGSAGLASDDLGAPIDVLWFRLPRNAARDPSRTGGTIRPGAMLVTLNRDSYWQCACVIPKGALPARWYRDGLLCIGDAAHAMSLVGGVGINLAIQDAVAASNLLAQPLRERRLCSHDLAAVQRRRDWPARVTQRAQIAIHNEVLAPTLAGTAAPGRVPLAVTLQQRQPLLRRLPARLVGMGVRPERVRTLPQRRE